MIKRTITDYHLLDKKADARHKRLHPRPDDPRLIRIAILGSFTLTGIKETLNVMCDDAGLILKSYVGPYNQYRQEILNTKSGLYKFDPQITILAIDVKDIFSDDYHFPYRMTSRQRSFLAGSKAKEIIGLAETFAKRCKGILLINDLAVPHNSPIGILEHKEEFGFHEMVRSINRKLVKHFKSNAQVFMFGYDNFLSAWGKHQSSDDAMYYLADLKISQGLIPNLCEEYMKYIKAVKGKSRKCIVCDLDNTLWGGIVGEDGFNGIRLGPTPPGNAFVAFQKYLLSLFERGIILAVNSSNNEADAIKVIKEHPAMVLKEHHFAAMRINWENKADNLSAIAKELNIGLDSMIYLDDDPRNCELVRKVLPQVLVADLPVDPALYVRTLQGCGDLDTLQITDEDKKRGLMYAAERQRKSSKTLFKDINNFLKDLDMEVTIKKANQFAIPRIAQLTQRTNQFNMTTKRYTEEAIASFMDKAGQEVYYIHVRDRFGDSGVVGAVFTKAGSGSTVIDNFLLSCRVLGKGVEGCVFSFLAIKAKKDKSKELVTEFVQTEKNGPALQFLKSTGSVRSGKTGARAVWRFDTAKDVSLPPHIKVVAS